MKQVLRYSAVLAVIAVALIASGCGSLAAPAAAGGYPPSNSITVTGSGEASGAPDIAYVMLGVSVTNADVGRAVEESNSTMQAITDAVTGMGIAAEDIQTIGFNVWPEDRYDPATGQPTGERVYHVDSNLQVKVRDLGTVGQVISTALDAGANSVSGLNFGIEDTAALEAEARTKAIEDARARAGQLAEAVGMTLGDPIIVTEYIGGYYPVYEAAAGGFGGGGGGGVPPISPGQLTVSVQVNVTFTTQ
jgi:uncharacterized protein YggE